MAKKHKKHPRPGKKQKAKQAFRPEQQRSAPGRMQDDELFQKLPPSVQKDMESLQRQENRIIDGLKNEEMKRLFIVDPGTALTRMKIKVPPELRKRLRPNEMLQRLFQPAKFRLANGQVVTAKVRINFTTGKKEE